MSRINNLMGKSEKFNIGGVELELKPFTLDEMDLFSIDPKAPLGEQAKATKKMITKVIKDAVPDATDEEISNISMKNMNDLVKAILKLNNMEAPNVSGNIKK